MRPTIPDVLPRVREFVRLNPVGGCLHAVLDDGNVRDSDVEYCRDLAVREGDAEAEWIAGMLLKMSRTQRRKISSVCHKAEP